LGEPPLFLLEPRGVVALPRDAGAAVELEDPAGDVVEEVAIVRDGHHRAGILVEVRLGRGDRFGVGMVGGLVEEEEIGLLEEHAAQGDAPALAARERAHVGVARRQAERVHRDLERAVELPGVRGVDGVLDAGLLAEELLHLRRRHVLAEAHRHLLEAREQMARRPDGLLDVLEDVLRRIEQRLLRQVADDDALGGRRVAREVVLDARHDAQQRALARPVRADHADLRAAVEGERDALQDLLPLGGDLAHVPHGEDEGRWHIAPGSPPAEKFPLERPARTSARRARATRARRKRGRRGFCNLRCVFCQNWELSQVGKGREMRPEELAESMLELQSRGCHNINFVTPEHVVPQLLEALLLAADAGLTLPLVYNTSAYDSLRSLELLDGVVDVYMPDYKYWDGARARRYLKAEDYPDVARRVIREMHRQVGPLRFDRGGLAVRGLLVRHLVMPGALDDAREIFRFLATEVSADTYVDVMDQYHPAGAVDGDKYPELCRRPDARGRPHARIGKDRGDALRLGQEDHVTHEVAEGRHHRRLCEVEPLKEHAPLKRAGRGREAASTVALEDVLDDRARLEHRELAVLEH